MSSEKATARPPQLDFEQHQRAALIAESRGIDDDTAHELVALRDSFDSQTELIETLETSLSLLAAEADQLELWAIESRSGGWSTHQVEPMNKQAAMLRNQESKLRSRLTLAREAAK